MGEMEGVEVVGRIKEGELPVERVVLRSFDDIA